MASDGVRVDELPLMSMGGGELQVDGRWESQVSVPVVSGRGAVVGSLIAGHHQPGFFEEQDVLVLQAVAAHFAVALDNHQTVARLSELEALQREAAHQLQYAVLPRVPAIEGAELGRFYLAADPTSLIGGDLYDLVVLPNGDLHLAVVDVLGKGVTGTKDALAVIYALRFLALGGSPIDGLIKRADALLSNQDTELVATVVVARFSPETGELLVVGGGHPPPLIVRSSGEVTELNLPGIAIGWPGAGSLSTERVVLDRSDTVIFYTDGLIEATKNVEVGLATLSAAAAETVGYPASQLARVLVERALAGAERRDDTLAVVLRRRRRPSDESEHRLGPFEHRFTPNLAVVPLARHLLLDWLQRQPIDPDSIDDLLLCATELCTNAIRASSGAPGSVALRAWANGDGVVLEMEDDGEGFAWPVMQDDQPPDPGIDRGRGLFLIRALTDEASIERRDDRTLVRCEKRAILGGRRS
jgi:serine phosphatase RsbU (regulator of sigma subunit)/anti-sigma regulatory factor (Ser/Thr protein kinase)